MRYSRTLFHFMFRANIIIIILYFIHLFGFCADVFLILCMYCVFYIFSANVMLHWLQMGSTVVVVVEVVIVPTILVYYTTLCLLIKYLL